MFGPDVVYDVAVPGDRTLDVLEQLPRGAVVLMQKPMGADLADAQRIRACVHDRGMIAAVNLQLRFSPGMLALRDLLRRNALGALVDIDVRIVIDQPWHLWPFLERVPRLELPYHSIHYLDAIRAIAGEPLRRVLPRAVGIPSLPAFPDTRSSIDSRLRRPDSLFAGPEPHPSRRPDAPGVAADRRGNGGAQYA